MAGILICIPSNVSQLWVLRLAAQQFCVSLPKRNLHTAVVHLVAVGAPPSPFVDTVRHFCVLEAVAGRKGSSCLAL